MKNPEIGMEVADCLDGTTATVVSSSMLRAHQISAALRSQAIEPHIEGLKPGLGQDFHVSCIPQSRFVTDRVPSPVAQPGLNIA
jgi:hypothetical protein